LHGYSNGSRQAERVTGQHLPARGRLSVGHLLGGWRIEGIEQQYAAAGDVHGFLLDKQHPSADFTINGYYLHVSLDSIFGSHTETGYGLIMTTGTDEFLGVGKGFRASFTVASGPNVGIASVDEGRFEEGKWIPSRRLNGDENDQGSFWRFDPRGLHTEKVKLYRFD